MIQNIIDNLELLNKNSEFDPFLILNDLDNISIEKNGIIIFNILKELKGVLSFHPGQLKAIVYIINLLKIAKNNNDLEILELYNTTDWKSLINFRGPVEAVLNNECNNCKNFFISIGISGFLDMNGFVCNNCGDVIFKSIYDENKIKKCECGGDFFMNCPICNDKKKYDIISEISPYEYFYQHKYFIL